MQRLSCRLPSCKSYRAAAAQEFELDGTKGEGVPSLQFLALDALHRESLDELTKEGCNKAFGPPSISPVAGGCDVESQSAWLWLSAVEAWEGQPFVAAHGLRAHKNKG